MIITCVHQGYELYGSDRSFAATVAGIRDAFPSAEIDVVLPRHGPIVPLLEGAASRIIIEPLWVLRRRDLKRLATIGLLELPAAVLRAWSRLRRSDIVYVNTSVVADYMIAARFCTGRSVIHIHEIPDGLTLRLLRTLVRWSRADIIFNSCATRDAFALPAGSAARVIYNGVAGPPEPLPQSFDGSRPLRLLMLGRFSRIKGQEVLIEALGLLPQRLRPEVRIVGGAFEDQSRARSLADLIAARGLADTVSLMPFTPDPGPLYRWADVVAVPLAPARIARPRGHRGDGLRPPAPGLRDRRARGSHRGRPDRLAGGAGFTPGPGPRARNHHRRSGRLGRHAGGGAAALRDPVLRAHGSGGDAGGAVRSPGA